MAPRFLVTRDVPGPGIPMLSDVGETTVLDRSPSYEDLRSMCASGDFDVVVTQLVDRVDSALIQTARVRGFANYAVGYDNIDVEAAASRGITVTNTPGVLTAPTADVAMLLILATARRCVEADAFVRSGRFVGWEPELLLGADVSGRRLGLIGWGRIARAVAQRALGFDMDVTFATVHDANRRRRPDELMPGVRQVELTELLRNSEFVSLHVPLSETTHHLIDRAALALMRNDAILINTARGPVVDERALVDALSNWDIAGAGLDVFEDEPRLTEGLAQLPNTVLLPHLGSATVRVRHEMSRLAATNAIAIASGDSAPHEVQSVSARR
ncbi:MULTISPECIES: 2-hydroxyacid dehydrogenase [unclassified Aeromicrobium]|uniref:2-hydroxyacid dehydrogenase n=1 Tax=unclassified Aeromicrobium TaxID=2633570 RepID=UPI00396B3E5E